jgi:hypothetical protein
MQFRSPPPLPTFPLLVKNLSKLPERGIAAFWCRVSVRFPCSLILFSPCTAPPRLSAALNLLAFVALVAIRSTCPGGKTSARFLHDFFFGRVGRGGSPLPTPVESYRTSVPKFKKLESVSTKHTVLLVRKEQHDLCRRMIVSSRQVDSVCLWTGDFTDRSQQVAIVTCQSHSEC